MALCDRLDQQTSDQLEAHETLVDTLLGTLTQSENATELADNWARLAAHFDTLFTTVRSRPFLSSSTWPMSRPYGRCSSDRFTCATCPTVSNPVGITIDSGRSSRKTCSYDSCSYDSSTSYGTSGDAASSGVLLMNVRRFSGRSSSERTDSDRSTSLVGGLRCASEAKSGCTERNFFVAGANVYLRRGKKENEQK